MIDDNTKEKLSRLDMYIRPVCCVLFLGFGIFFMFAGFDQASNHFCTRHHNVTKIIDDKYYVLGMHGTIVIWNQTTGCIFVGGAIIVYILCEFIGTLERCLYKTRAGSTGAEGTLRILSHVDKITDLLLIGFSVAIFLQSVRGCLLVFGTSVPVECKSGQMGPKLPYTAVMIYSWTIVIVVGCMIFLICPCVYWKKFHHVSYEAGLQERGERDLL